MKSTTVTVRTLALGAASAILLAASPVLAQELRADQQAALELILEQIDPAHRETARPQMQAMVATLNPAQIAAMTAELKAQSKAASAPNSEPARQSSADDHAYNKAQYEPAIRRAWMARNAFDKHVDARLATLCPARDRYAVYGAGFR